MTKERHIQYSNAIRDLQTASGESLSNEARVHLLKVLKKSNGNISAFLKIVSGTKKLFVDTAIKNIREDFLTARKTGKEFQDGV
jgi:hypothetical protein